MVGKKKILRECTCVYMCMDVYACAHPSTHGACWCTHVPGCAWAKVLAICAPRQQLTHRGALQVPDHHLEPGLGLSGDSWPEDDGHLDGAEGADLPLGHLHREPMPRSADTGCHPLPPTDPSESHITAGHVPGWLRVTLALPMSTYG